MSSKLQILIGMLLIAVPADQLSKLAIEQSLRIGERIEVVPGLLYITHARNPGAAFGVASDLPGTAFIGVSLVALVLLALFYRRAAPGDRLLVFGLSSILAGAIGNASDRIVRGEVIDFLHVRLWPGYAWPDFNFADVCIVLGVASLIIDLLAREALQRAGLSEPIEAASTREHE